MCIRDSPVPAAAAGTGAAAGAAKTPAGSAVKDRHLLSPDQINTIKQAELRDDEPRVRVRLENNLCKKYIQLPNITQHHFAAMPDAIKTLNTPKKGTHDMRK